MDPDGKTTHFEEAIKEYIKEHRYGNAVQMDLYGELDKVLYTLTAISTSSEVRLSFWILNLEYNVLRDIPQGLMTNSMINSEGNSHQYPPGLPESPP